MFPLFDDPLRISVSRLAGGSDPARTIPSDRLHRCCGTVQRAARRGNHPDTVHHPRINRPGISNQIYARVGRPTCSQRSCPAGDLPRRIAVLPLSTGFGFERRNLVAQYGQYGAPEIPALTLKRSFGSGWRSSLSHRWCCRCIFSPSVKRSAGAATCCPSC